MKVLSAAALAGELSPRAAARSSPHGTFGRLPCFCPTLPEKPSPEDCPMMTKALKCGTVVPGCEFTVHAETDAELLAKIADHARAAHDIEHISEPLRAKILAAARSS